MRRTARRAEGWLPVVRPGLSGREFSAVAVSGPVSEVRRLAAKEGRNPSRLDVILRVYPTKEATVEQVVEAIVGTERDTEVEHVFVDLMEVATGVDEALEVAYRIRNCPATSVPRSHDAVSPPIREPIDHLRERRPDRRIAGPHVSRKTRTIAGEET